jgi:hypothetical protein
MQFEDDALVTFNHDNVTISCSCRKYESKGMQSDFDNFSVYDNIS